MLPYLCAKAISDIYKVTFAHKIAIKMNENRFFAKPSNAKCTKNRAISEENKW